MSMLDIAVERGEGTTTVTLSGELDISETSRIEQELLAVERGSPPVLQLDLRGLTFIDSSGLRLILEADVRARKDGRRLILVPGPDAVHRIFLIALLDKRLEFVDEPHVGGDPNDRP